MSLKLFTYLYLLSERNNISIFISKKITKNRQLLPGILHVVSSLERVWSIWSARTTADLNKFHMISMGRHTHGQQLLEQAPYDKNGPVHAWTTPYDQQGWYNKYLKWQRFGDTGK